MFGWGWAAWAGASQSDAYDGRLKANERPEPGNMTWPVSGPVRAAWVEPWLASAWWSG